MVYQWITLGCLIVVVLALAATIYYLRRAAKFDRITAKLRTGEALSDQETRLLETVSEAKDCQECDL